MGRSAWAGPGRAGLRGRVQVARVWLNEPVARYGPFVMNTGQEIHQAIEDYQRRPDGSRPGHQPGHQVPLRHHPAGSLIPGTVPDQSIRTVRWARCRLCATRRALASSESLTQRSA
ncbi:pirin-like C-terminal cupin domain-containing protein [Streptomyces sp. NPDC059909]|uniref:pirin-like C-terminal cupin domain-containing protein n=1 Tax=Streptomyces sp. NPDC059909 TaxID=3346998 RepID=UPI0036690100